jgi:hypothetical protein
MTLCLVPPMALPSAAEVKTLLDQSTATQNQRQ